MSDADMDASIREAQTRLDGIVTLTEMLNGFRQNLVDAGWDEERAEHAALMWWSSQTGGYR